MGPEYALIMGGDQETIDMVSPDPTSNPVPDCMKALGNFPKQLCCNVGTTFGKFNAEKIKTVTNMMVTYSFPLLQMVYLMCAEVEMEMATF